MRFLFFVMQFDKVFRFTISAGRISDQFIIGADCHFFSIVLFLPFFSKKSLNRYSFPVIFFDF